MNISAFQSLTQFPAQIFHSGVGSRFTTNARQCISGIATSVISSFRVSFHVVDGVQRLRIVEGVDLHIELFGQRPKDGHQPGFDLSEEVGNGGVADLEQTRQVIQRCCQLLDIHLLSRFRLDRGTLQVVSLLIESVK
jgi:hypothetical protein